MTNPYPDLACDETTCDGVTRMVFRGGAGPAVIVIHEIPGLHPGVVAFGRRLIAAGMTAYFPSLFGEPGREPSAGNLVGPIMRACVSRELATWASARPARSPRGCVRWPATPTRRAVAPASARSACA